MRILIFSTDDFLFPAGGAERAIGEITKRLPEFEFDLVCARLRRQSLSYEKIGNVEIHRFGFGLPKIDGYLLALFGCRKALALYKKYGHNLIWLVMASYGGFAAVCLKEKTGLPFLLTLQEGDEIKKILHKVRFISSRFKKIFSSADGLQSISNFLDKWGREMGFVGQIREVIPNGVDYERFCADFDTKEIIVQRQSFNFPQDSIILVTSSRLVEKNGIGDVISALASLPKNICFVICGDGHLKTKLIKQTEKLGLTDRVRFLGFVPPEKLPKIFKACDVFIRPSLSEGLGNAFLEAMAASLPVIGTNVGGIPDFLADGQTGFFCQPKNSRSIAETINKIINLPEKNKKEIILRARNLVKEKYTWDNIASQMKYLFLSLINRI